jgi:hypothetical protein
MVFEVEGFDKQIHMCDEDDDTHKIPIEKLFSSSFMRRNTDVSTFPEFMERSPWNIESMQEFEALIWTQDFDEYIDAHTEFSSWRELFLNAGQEWIDTHQNPHRNR